MTPTQVYGNWVSSCSSDWHKDALESAHRELIDTVAVMIPGAQEPCTQLAYKTIDKWCPNTGTGSNVVGTTQSLPAPWAALINGTAGHALDFDDNFDPPKAHASTVLYPAIFAVADAEDLSGKAVLDAYIVGLQIMGRIGQGVNPAHRDRGWHATATVGVFGAAAACARLLKLDSEKCTHALSLASSMSSGFMSQFGTMTKPLHAGLAAQRGVIAAYLAREGFEGGLNTLDGPHGMNTLMVGPDREELMRHLTGEEHGQTLSFEVEHVGEPVLITAHGFRVKRFPNCGSAHRAMDILLDLIQENELKPDNIEQIEVHAPEANLNNLFYHDPKNGLEAKFSMQYALACLMEYENCKLSDFTDEASVRKNIRRHYSKIILDPIEKLESVCPTTVVVRCADNNVYEGTAKMPKGSLNAPFDTEQYWSKLQDCVKDLLTPSHIEQLRMSLERFPDIDSCSEMTRYFAFQVNQSPDNIQVATIN
jgi:2-methylcitrate dehydratase PrpD